MFHDRYITIRVAYDSHPGCGRSLKWVAPELSGADLALIEDHINDPHPSRTWAGKVDDATFKRLAQAWHIDDDSDEYTFDGMNWEAGGISPIIYVSLWVGAPTDDDRAGFDCNAVSRRHHTRRPIPRGARVCNQAFRRPV